MYRSRFLVLSNTYYLNSGATKSIVGSNLLRYRCLSCRTQVRRSPSSVRVLSTADGSAHERRCKDVLLPTPQISARDSLCEREKILMKPMIKKIYI